MALEQNSNFPDDKIAEMLTHFAEYIRLKEEILGVITKATSGKMNTLDMQAVGQWFTFIQENPKSVTSTEYSISDFGLKLKGDTVLAGIEKEEAKARAVTKAYRDVVSSDARYYWTTAEDFYIAAAEKDPILKEKYKDLPSISPKRKSDTQIENDFKKLEARRNKKNGDKADPKE